MKSWNDFNHPELFILLVVFLKMFNILEVV